MIAQPAEAGDRREPRPGERGEVQPVGGIAREVVEVDERRLAKVVVGEIEVTDLGGDDAWMARRQRRVAHGDALVVVEVAPSAPQ